MDDDASRFTWGVIKFVAVALAIILYLTIAQYKHPDPPKDCSQPSLYPICSRATTPQALPPPSSAMQYLSIVTAAILAILLVYVSYHASVIEQANLITGASEVKTPPPIAPPASSTGQIVSAKLEGK